MPSILVETGFLTNREEEKYLNSEKGQNEISSGVLNAITAYKNEVESSGSESGGEIKGESESEGGKNNRAEVGHSDSTTVQSSASKISDSDSHNNKLPGSSPSPSADQIIYRIQITASSKPLNLKEARFSSFKEIKNDKSATGINRYVVGNYLSRDECLKELELIRKKGFKD